MVSAILPHNARSRRVAERFGARADGQMEAVGVPWDRYVWSLATGACLRIWRSSNFMQLHTPRRLMDITRSKSSREASAASAIMF